MAVGVPASLLRPALIPSLRLLAVFLESSDRFGLSSISSFLLTAC